LVKREYTNTETERHIKAKPPKEAYFYFPKGNDIVEYDEKTPTKTTRRVFEAGVQFLQYEKDRLKDLNTEIEKYNEKNPNKRVIFPDSWNERNTLRFLQATGYNNAKTIEYLIAHFEFRGKTFPIKINDKVIEILNSGFLYSHGRDQRFRPILVINAKIYKKKHKDTYSTDDWVLAVMYFMEYIINNLVIPGQVENWNIICDVDEISVVFLPGDLKKIIEILQCNYRARLYVMYIVNISIWVKALWKVIKGMLDPNTEKKIRMIGSDNSQMFEFINKSQVEKRFGGTASNVEDAFFPHVNPDPNVFNAKEDRNKYLIDEESYCEFVEKNPQYVKSPYIDWEKRKAESKIVFEGEDTSSSKLPPVDSSSNSSPFSTNTHDKVSVKSLNLKPDEIFDISSEPSSTEISKSMKKINNNVRKPSISMDGNKNK